MPEHFKSFAILAGGAPFASAPAWAHHAFSAEFDENKKIPLRERVTQLELTNPHVWIHLDFKTPDGTVANWMVENGPPNGRDITLGNGKKLSAGSSGPGEKPTR